MQFNFNPQDWKENALRLTAEGDCKQVRALIKVKEAALTASSVLLQAAPADYFGFLVLDSSKRQKQVKIFITEKGFVC